LRAWLRHQRRIELADRVVVITGASSGFGLLMARHAAEQGARLVLAARDADALRQAAEELRAGGAPEVLVIPTDVADEQEARRLIGHAIERFGQVDVLINNAGTILVGPLPAMSIEDFRNVVATNLWGAIYTSMAVIPHMRERRFGRIGNIVSVGGRIAAPHLAPYNVSKFGLTGFTRSLRVDLARDNILVTGIYPKTIRTGGHTHAWFKGDQLAEYTWFALSDTLPGISASADTAARKTLRAICDGDPELVIGLSTRAAIAFDSLFPTWSAELTALIERALPGPVHLEAPAVQGQQLQGRLPSLLNRMVPEAARP
ncbi:MAG: SDR family NAD(P)-dependent oxidoreductase, partial [Isosphaeraceae bacterium]|nr:SDR family NAD(P)-dependent oxidoreductase [Isosphaeraceae bacterium]